MFIILDISKASLHKQVDVMGLLLKYIVMVVLTSDFRVVYFLHYKTLPGIN